MSNTDLVQLLSALVSINNEERSQAETLLNDDWIARRPDNLLSELVNQISSATDSALRSFACVLLRKIAPKELSGTGNTTDEQKSVWEHTTNETHAYVKDNLISAFLSEQEKSVRHKLADLLAEIVQLETVWPEFAVTALRLTQSDISTFRESAYRIFSTSPELLGTEFSAELREIFTKGLQDADLTVKLAAMEAFSIFLIVTTATARARAQELVPLLMNVLPPLLQSKNSESLTTALNSITELVESFPKLFQSMFPDMLNFCLATIRDKDLDNQTRQASLEVLVLFAESAPGMCRKNADYASSLVVECLALMTDLGDDEDTSEWLASEDMDADESDANHVAGEQALDRLARKLGGKTILPPSFTWLPKLIASTNWQERHAALMAVSSIAEGCERLMRVELGKVLAMVLPSLQDVHPRVRWAACNAVGQMCTDFGGDVQKGFTSKVLDALTPILDQPESRVATHAAAAFVNFSTLR